MLLVLLFIMNAVLGLLVIPSEIQLHMAIKQGQEEVNRVYVYDD